MKQERFDSIDGLRSISCLAIIAMHIQANTNYQISGYFWDTVIPSWTWFVPLFILISGFSMCAGYLNRFINGEIDLEQFYIRRYKKILPFFSFLILIALVMEHSVQAIYEGTFELTLLFGLLPNCDMDVLGVCWTLGLIFLFYLLFPAFSVLMRSKKRAWASLLISLWLVYVCINHFFGEKYVVESFTYRHSFLYCLPLFIVGGIIFLYRDAIKIICSRYRFVLLALCIGFTVAWYLIGGNEIIFFIKTLLMFALWLIYAIGVESKFLQCKPLHFLSGISLEMYLAQMVVFRVVEKLKLLYLLGTGWISYFLAFIFVVAGLVLLIWIFRCCYNYFCMKLIKMRRA